MLPPQFLDLRDVPGMEHAKKTAQPLARLQRLNFSLL